MRGRWAVALRIARRSALASWGRSLLIVALIAVPIAGLAGAAVLLPSTQSTLQERIAGTLGRAEAKLTPVGGPGLGVRQGVEGGYSYEITNPDSTDYTVVDPRTALPPNTRTIAVDSGAATFQTPRGSVSLQVIAGETWDPSLDGGPYALLSGSRPTAADEVLLSPAALDRLGATVGDEIRMLESARTLTVVGLLADRSVASSTPIVFGTEGLAPEATLNALYVPSTPLDWAAVQRLNAIGTTVFSREVVLDPPADAPAYGEGGGFNAATTAVLALAVVFAVFEVSLLAGSAFLVGARLQQRSMAMIAAVGADRSVLRRIVTANGVVLGAAGGAIGVALGIGGAVALMRLTDDGTWTRYPGLHLQWPVLAAVALLGIVVGWIAALVPARAASQFDVVRALRGARTPQTVDKRPVAGVIVLIVGIATTLAGGAALLAALQNQGDLTGPVLGAVALLGGGSLLTQVGVLLSAGLLLRGIAAGLRAGPLPARLAARDTSRNLGRAVPAVASVMTTVFIAAFVMCIANATSKESATTYSWILSEPGAAVAYLSSADPEGPDAAFVARSTAILGQDLPVRDALAVGLTPMGTTEPEPSDRRRDAQAVVRPAEPSAICTEAQMANDADRSCGRYSAVGGRSWSSANRLTVGDEQALALILGHEPSPAASEVLRQGGVVALKYGLERDGVATLDWFTPKQFTNGVDESLEPVRSDRLPAVVDLPVNPTNDALFTTTATAERLGLAVPVDRVLLDLTRTPTDDELDAANTALSALANQPGSNPVYVEQGPQDYGALIA